MIQIFFKEDQVCFDNKEQQEKEEWKELFQEWEEERGKNKVYEMLIVFLKDLAHNLNVTLQRLEKKPSEKFLVQQVRDTLLVNANKIKDFLSLDLLQLSKEKFLIIENFMLLRIKYLYAYSVIQKTFPEDFEMDYS